MFTITDMSQDKMYFFERLKLFFVHERLNKIVHEKKQNTEDG